MQLYEVNGPASPRRRRLLRALPAWLGGHWQLARAQERQGISEYQVKAAFVCKFGNFVEWPSGAFSDLGAPFIIAVAGAGDVIAQVSLAAEGLHIGGRPVVVRRLRRGDSLSGIQVLFIAQSAEGQVAQWLAAVKQLPVLTVTESDEGLALGSSINFVVVDNKVRFDVAPQTAQQNAIRVDSRLLSVARKVVGGSPP